MSRSARTGQAGCTEQTCKYAMALLELRARIVGQKAHNRRFCDKRAKEENYTNALQQKEWVSALDWTLNVLDVTLEGLGLREAERRAKFYKFFRERLPFVQDLTDEQLTELLVFADGVINGPRRLPALSER